MNPKHQPAFPSCLRAFVPSCKKWEACLLKSFRGISHVQFAGHASLFSHEGTKARRHEGKKIISSPKADDTRARQISRQREKRPHTNPARTGWPERHSSPCFSDTIFWPGDPSHQTLIFFSSAQNTAATSLPEVAGSVKAVQRQPLTAFKPELWTYAAAPRPFLRHGSLLCTGFYSPGINCATVLLRTSRSSKKINSSSFNNLDNFFFN